ncbi:hypothetical protein GGS23DRAFT_214358 [Durotheca rogersii]|uniref:uncharacterized protein n=1 Tax=Durotheca rogersii TaxID=419775 RepID=UPI00221FDBDA|nr:uncharacterized protein GGS23DRAFT_214358 [Durotheca rogersii]KAI5860861.1 hypothetical protein GGS23DRAFT_214358 [Durotheca rogersii]
MPDVVMEFIRTNVLRRGPSSQGQPEDLERQRQPEMGERRDTRTRGTSGTRPPVRPLFTSRSRRGERNRRVDGNGPDEDGPKTPRFNLGLPIIPSARPHGSNLSRPSTQGSSRPPSSGQTQQPPQPESSASPPRTRSGRIPVISEPPPSHVSDSSGAIGPGRTRFRGADPAETQLADTVHRRSRRRHYRDQASESDEGRKRFMFCFPWVKSRRMRSQILRCFVSGIFLVLMLTVYLVLSVTKNINSNEFTVLLVLVVLFATIFFCHGLIKICMLILKPPKENDEEHPPMPQLMQPGGYAIPRRPIHVILARDEEVAGIVDTANKTQPPAYGLWRESVRVDPNRLYWQRNDQPPAEDSEEQPTRPGTVQTRPPSYASEDGVTYVVEARPRSIVPPLNVPLPPHPSEVPLPDAEARRPQNAR